MRELGADPETACEACLRRSWLLARHPATTVTPFALLVPVVGLLSSALLLGESLPAWKVVAAALVIAGLALNVFGPRWQRATLAKA